MTGPLFWAIERSYFDAFGHRHDVAADDLDRIAERLAGVSGQGGRLHGGIFVARRDQSNVLLLAADAATPHWELRHDGQARPLAVQDGAIDLPGDVAVGSYVLAGGEGANGAAYPLLMAPRTAYQPPFARAGRRLWLLAVQLYAVRSRRNWGHGDFTDLRHLLELAAEAKAAGVGVNPLHALPAGQASPYSPSSRLFLNPLYIALDAVVDFCEAEMIGLADDLARLRATDLVDYAQVAALKEQALRRAWHNFRKGAGDERRRAFEQFRAERGEELARFAAFETLRLHHRAPWWDWPQEWRTPTPAMLAQLRRDSDDMAYVEYVQWLADEQLRACRDRARELDLPVGLYLDLAVGVALDGADAWAEQDTLAPGLVLGAPPDAWNPAGQNWGIASFHPQALIDTDFFLFRQTLRSVMRYAGAIRIDHALGLNRVFLIPQGREAARGTYVAFPFQAMLAVVAQESERARCLVIGEDLGTVPEGVSETLRDWGVWSYRVALFERHGDHHFRDPGDYPADALVTFTTHDLPTFAGWMSERDLDLKRELGIDAGEAGRERGRTREGLHHALHRHGIHVQETLSFVDVARFLARTPSRLLAISVEDVLEITDQVNVPGTVTEYQNWMKRLPANLEELPAHENIGKLAAALAAEGRSTES